jgi:hypothetical protein
LETKDSDGDSTPIVTPSSAGADGDTPTDDSQYIGSQQDKTGLYALEKADLFNILCIPPVSRTVDITNATWTAAAQYCLDRRAFLQIG